MVKRQKTYCGFSITCLILGAESRTYSLMDYLEIDTYFYALLAFNRFCWLNYACKQFHGASVTSASRKQLYEEFVMSRFDHTEIHNMKEPNTASSSLRTCFCTLLAKTEQEVLLFQQI